MGAASSHDAGEPDVEKAELLGRAARGGEYGADDDGLYMGELKEQLLDTGEQGLTEHEAAHRLARFGRNELREKETNHWMKLAQEFVQPMPLIIWAAILIECIEAYVNRSGNPGGEGRNKTNIADITGAARA
mmetsp:Transcript_24324/g.79373  ORF Transcript_24324/g.79373 Transcript_24324/m.79373 type:complete len:132 (+) Transcript_24324:868-1263(+)